MKINHLNLTVTDVLAAANFLKKYFGLSNYWGGYGGEDNEKFTVLFDEDGFVLTLMKAGRNKQVKYPGFFHIGFIQESEEKVNEINQRLKEDGFDVSPPKRSHAWTFYVKAPGGFSIEVLT